MSNNDICNVASLEHCYTNLFSLIDLTGIKWLRLRERKIKDKNQKKERKAANEMNEDTDSDEDADKNSDADQLNNESTPKKSSKSTGAETTGLKSSTLFTSSVNDPILLTHAKCMNEDILSAWKRVDIKKKQKKATNNFNDSSDNNHMETNNIESESSIDSDDQDGNDNLLELNNSLSLKKELWIFWYEKEEPPNLRSLISSNLYVDSSDYQSQNQNNSSNNHNHGNNTNLSFNQNQTMQNTNSITQQACSSNNGLPYESRSMLFKALHNLIEKSLIDKGFTRLGKWFVTPYNINKKINGEETLEFDLLSKMNKESNFFKSEANGNEQGEEIEASPKLHSPVGSSIQADEHNHVSYSFSFFLHGSSRVCTSVDMKLHRPIRLLNTNDLFKLRSKMSRIFSTSASSANILPSSLLFNNENRSSRRTKFKGIEVILAPYGISANLLGYISNDSAESQLTCTEWSQFYSLRLSPNLPRVFVVGLENNTIKLFYPNSFVFVVINDEETADENNIIESAEDNLFDSCSEQSDHSEVDTSYESSDYDELNTDRENYSFNQTNQRKNRKRRNNKKKINKSSSFMSNSSSPNHKSKQKKSSNLNKFTENKDADKTNKEMDSLELTIDSVARNFGTDLATGTDSSSDDNEMQQDIQPSPTASSSVKANNPSSHDQKQSSPKLTSPSIQANSTKSPNVIPTNSPKGVNSLARGDQSAQTITSPDASLTEEQRALKRTNSAITKFNINCSASANTETDGSKFKRTKSMNFNESTNGDKSPKQEIVKSKSFNIESNFENLTKKTFENNYTKFNTFFSKFKNKKLIARLFLTPMPNDARKKQNSDKNKSLTDSKLPSPFSASDFKKTRRLLKTYMNRKTKQKIMRLRIKKRRRQLAKEQDERNRTAALKKKLKSVKLLQYLIENNNNSKLKNLIQKNASSEVFNPQIKKQKCNCQRQVNLNNFDAFSSNLTSPNSSNSSISSSMSTSSIVSETNQENGFPLSLNTMNKECKCSRFDYTIENQIRLKHKQVELINENLPLTFDILDRCQILSSTFSNSSVFYSTCSQHSNMRPPSGPPPPGTQKPNCTCSGLVGTQSSKIKQKPKFKSPKTGGLKVKSESSPSNTDMSLDASDKQAPFSLNTFSTKPSLSSSFNLQSQQPKDKTDVIMKTESNKTSDLTSSKPGNKTPQKNSMKHLNVNTQIEQPFHRRQCYLNSHKSDRFKQAKLSVAKTIQLPNKEISQKPSSDRTYITQVINVKDDEENNEYSSNDQNEYDAENEVEIAEENGQDQLPGKRRKKIKKLCECNDKKKLRIERPNSFISDDGSMPETDSDSSNENIFDHLKKINKKELSEDTKKEDIEFKELKSLLLKFEKNAPNMSSDFDLSGYEDLVESSNNNIILDSDTDENTSNEQRLKKYRFAKKSKNQAEKKNQALAETDYQYFVMDDNDSLLEMSRKNSNQQSNSLNLKRIKNSFSTTSSSSSSSLSDSDSSNSESSDGNEKLKKSTNGLVSSSSDTSSGSSILSDKIHSNSDLSYSNASDSLNSDTELIDGSKPNGTLSSKIDLNNLFNGVQTNVGKNSRRVKAFKSRNSNNNTKKALINGIEHESIDSVLNKRPCLKNLTNNSIQLPKKADDLEKSKEKSKIELARNTRNLKANETSNETESVQNTEFEEEEVLVDFNRLYELENNLDTSLKQSLQNSELSNQNSEQTKFDDGSQQIGQPGSSKQMTPPKSVESVTSNLQPLSNQSQATTNALFPSTARTPSASSNLITSNSNTILPPTYDDLNNIFEEDSADEQNQNHATVKEAPSLLNTFTTQPINNNVSSQVSMDTGNNLPKDPLVPALHSKAATPLSVVMTPPSLDLPNQAQCFADDLAQPASNANITHTQLQNEPTKSIEFNDYSSIISNKNRKNFSSLLIKNLSEYEKGDEKMSIDTEMKEIENISMEKIFGKYEKLNTNILKKNDTTKKTKKTLKNSSIDLNYKSQHIHLKNKSITSTDSNSNDKESLKKQFKYLVKSINNNLDQIDAMKKQSLHSTSNPTQKSSAFNSLTYVHYNSSTSHNKQNNSNKDSQNPALKQPLPVQPQHHTLTRTNSSTNPGYYQAMSNASMNSYTAPSTPQQLNHQFQQAPSPYPYQQAPLSNQSSYPGSSSAMLNTNIGTPTNQQSFMNTGPGSVGPANTSQIYQQQHNSSQINSVQNVSMSGGQGGVPSVQNQDYSMNVDQSPLLSGNIKQQNKHHQSNSLGNNLQATKSVKTETHSSVSQLKPGKLKPLDNIAILNKKSFLKSNLDLKFYLNSLCFSLNLSDTFNNCYRDINFDSCSLCVCNNNYLKGLDYSIYICNDIFNSNIDYYDYSHQIEEGEQTNATNQQVNTQQNKGDVKNNFAGLYVINNENEIKNTKENMVKQEPHNNFASSQQNHNQSFTHDSSSQLQQQSQQTCTCGFSAIVNRRILSTKAQAIDLNKFLKKFKEKENGEMNSSELSLMIPYMKLINLIKKNMSVSFKSSLLSNQLVILDSNNCNGLFFEDYLESLNLNVPHSLIKQCLRLNESLKNEQKTRNFLLNSILVRENYKWKKSFTFQMAKFNQKEAELKQKQEQATKQQQVKSDFNQSLTSSGKKPTKKQQQQMLKDQQQLVLNSSITNTGDPSSSSLELIDENLYRKQNGQFEITPNNILDLFDTKYSCSFLGIHEVHDLYYSSQSCEFVQNFVNKGIRPEYEDNCDSNQMKLNELKKGKSLKKKPEVCQLSALKSINLNYYDENKSGFNVLKRLITKTKLNRSKLKMTQKLSINEKNGQVINVNDEKFDKLTSLDDKSAVSASSFLYSKWMHEKKEIKSNLELTKSLKQIQPLLEETVQKKYTTAKMWDSFQGPLTWQHFCRLAFKDTASNHTSSHHLESTSLSAAQSSNSNDKNSANSAGGSSSNEGKSSSSSSHHQHCYEPEPIPAFLVSSLDKEWMAISPYAVKFWDKLNLEPYSKQKNISYIVLVPDFESEIFDNFKLHSSSNSSKSTEEKDYINYFLKNTTPGNNTSNTGSNRSKRQSNIANSVNEINRSIKDYFKELTSTYELLRLGLHRPALRIAPDSGFVKVPVLLNNQASTKYLSPETPNSKKKTSRLSSDNINNPSNSDSTDPKIVKEEPGSMNTDNGNKISGAGTSTFPSSSSSSDLTSVVDSKSTSAIDVNKWFDEIQYNQSTSLIGKNLKSFAQIFKLLALKISSGYSSTLASNIQKSFVAEKKTAQQQSTSTQEISQPSKTQFASTLIPTMSSINLDRTLYEELKPCKLAMSMPVITATSTASTSTQAASSSGSSSNSMASTNSLLSNLLTQRSTFSEVVLDPINSQNTSSSPRTSMMPQPQAQILTNYNQYSSMNNHQNSMNTSSNPELHDNIFNTNRNPNQSQQQNTNSLSQLTANLTTPPALFVYIIDPFDYFTYINSKLKGKSNENARNSFEKRSSKTGNKTPNTSLNAENKEEPSRVKEEKIVDEDLNDNSMKENINESNTENQQEENQNDNNNDESGSTDKEFFFNEFDLKRLRTLGLFKAYLEMLNNIPDLFKYSTQFQILPLNLCMDMQQQSTSMYIQSLMQVSTSSSNYSSCFAGGYGTTVSDLDMDYKLSLLKRQAFNSFSLSRRYFMSPAHNYYMQLQQQQLQQSCTRAKTLTGFGPAGYEQELLRETLLDDGKLQPIVSMTSNLNLSQMRKMNFYAPPYILAPPTIASSTVALGAANLFFKNIEPAASSGTNKPAAQTQQQQAAQNNGTGECNQLMSNFIQLNMANSSYGYLNSTSYQNLIKGQNNAHMFLPAKNNSIVQQPHQQQCNVLYVAYCLSEDQRYLLTSLCDENGELLESTSISVEIDERSRRHENHARRIGLRKLWEFIIAVISQTCKPWRLVIGRLGRIGHSEIKGWGCLLGKKNLQRVCAELKEKCETCNLLGNMEMPSILSGCLISLETCDNICIYPEAYSKEDKSAAAALNGQQLTANHAAQSHGISCTHILTFPASAIVQILQQNNMMGSIGMKDGDPLSKSDINPMDDGDFFNIFNLDDEDLDFLGTGDKGFNVSGTANEGDQTNMKEKAEALLNQEEIPHLDQQPLAVGYYVSTAKCGPMPKWLRGDVSSDTNSNSFKATLHIHNRYALENDELAMQVKTDYSHKLDSSVTYEVLRYVLERYNALSWLNIDPLTQDRKSCLPINHTVLLQLYYAFKNYI